MSQPKQCQRETLQILAFHLIPLLLTLPFSSASIQCYKCRGKDCAKPEIEIKVCISTTNVCYARLQKNHHQHRDHGEVRGCSNAATKCDLARHHHHANTLDSETITLEFPRHFCQLCNGEDLCNNGRELGLQRKNKEKGGFPSHDVDIEEADKEVANVAGKNQEEDYEDDYIYQHPNLPDWVPRTSLAVTPLLCAGFWRGYARALVPVLGVSWGFLFRWRGF